MASLICSNSHAARGTAVVPISQSCTVRYETPNRAATSFLERPACARNSRSESVVASGPAKIDSIFFLRMVICGPETLNERCHREDYQSTDHRAHDQESFHIRIRRFVGGFYCGFLLFVGHFVSPWVVLKCTIQNIQKLCMTCKENIQKLYYICNIGGL